MFKSKGSSATPATPSLLAEQIDQVAQFEIGQEFGADDHLANICFKCLYCYSWRWITPDLPISLKAEANACSRHIPSSSTHASEIPTHLKFSSITVGISHSLNIFLPRQHAPQAIHRLFFHNQRLPFSDHLTDQTYHRLTFPSGTDQLPTLVPVLSGAGWGKLPGWPRCRVASEHSSPDVALNCSPAAYRASIIFSGGRARALASEWPNLLSNPKFWLSCSLGL
ncbi:hypothetical protein BKA65DRAFT_293807 [Rhexocercosporidium sp. MPI-PUGE-AT-0058]|nr:hypothetical protein BKA65DRAFT_293807 [Rhexocercosporidium sp. MPI-PUGE-AT-0058]